VEAAERIRAAAAELGYRPNPAAQSLRLGKTRTIGFISDRVTVTRYASGMIQGALETAREYGHTVLMAETSGDEDALGEAVQSMLDRRVDGLMLGLMGARLVTIPPVPHDVPVVIVNGRTTQDHPGVLPDERTAGHTMARLLVDAGHRRIGLVGPIPEAATNPRRSVTIGERFVGIHAALAEADVVPYAYDVPDWIPSIGYETTNRLLDEHPDVTAMLAGNDNMAFGAFQALAERGLRVPDDISVVSFDDEELAGYLRPGLTTSRLPYAEMARQSVEMLLGVRELSHELIPMPTIIRDSVTRPR
jgi:LacI family transcriptional regulator